MEMVWEEKTRRTFSRVFSLVFAVAFGWISLFCFKASVNGAKFLYLLGQKGVWSFSVFALFSYATLFSVVCGIAFALLTKTSIELLVSPEAPKKTFEKLSRLSAGTLFFMSTGGITLSVMRALSTGVFPAEDMYLSIFLLFASLIVLIVQGVWKR